MKEELKELAVGVRYTEEIVGPVEKLHFGFGITEDQMERSTTWILRYGDLVPRRRSCVVLQNAMAPESPLVFTLKDLDGLDRVIALFVSDTWWTTPRADRETEFVRAALLNSLARADDLVYGPDGRSLLFEGEITYCEEELADRIDERISEIMERARG